MLHSDIREARSQNEHTAVGEIMDKLGKDEFSKNLRDKTIEVQVTISAAPRENTQQYLGVVLATVKSTISTVQVAVAIDNEPIKEYGDIAGREITKSETVSVTAIKPGKDIHVSIQRFCNGKSTYVGEVTQIISDENGIPVSDVTIYPLILEYQKTLIGDDGILYYVGARKQG